MLGHLRDRRKVESRLPFARQAAVDVADHKVVLAEREGASRAEAIECVLHVLHVLKTCPPIEQLGPPPGQARRGSLGAVRDDGDAVDERLLARIRALLAKAESTTFPEEAESLSAKAQELMTRHRIDSALLGGPGGGSGGRRIWIDDPYAAPKVSLLSAVARANGCRAVELGNLGCVHVVGFPADLEVVELLHTSLLVQAASARIGSEDAAARRLLQ